MLDTVPLSAIALCYAPLAIVIVSLFTFFVLTDRHARRLYLRRQNPLPDALRAKAPPPSYALTAETPSGGLVTVAPDNTIPATMSSAQVDEAV